MGTNVVNLVRFAWGYYAVKVVFSSVKVAVNVSVIRYVCIDFEGISAKTGRNRPFSKPYRTEKTCGRGNAVLWDNMFEVALFWVYREASGARLCQMLRQYPEVNWSFTV